MLSHVICATRFVSGASLLLPTIGACLWHMRAAPYAISAGMTPLNPRLSKKKEKKKGRGIGQRRPCAIFKQRKNLPSLQRNKCSFLGLKRELNLSVTTHQSCPQSHSVRLLCSLTEFSSLLHLLVDSTRQRQQARLNPQFPLSLQPTSHHPAVTSGVSTLVAFIYSRYPHGPEGIVEASGTWAVQRKKKR